MTVPISSTDISSNKCPCHGHVDLYTLGDNFIVTNISWLQNLFRILSFLEAPSASEVPNSAKKGTVLFNRDVKKR